MKLLTNALRSIRKTLGFKTSSRRVWVLDPGHSAHTSGKRSSDNTFFEYEFNRDVAHRLYSLLRREKIDVYFSLDDYDAIKSDKLSLWERVRNANNLSETKDVVFLSIHANAQQLDKDKKWGTARGVEVWYYEGNEFTEKLATDMVNTFSTVLSLVNRGIKSSETLFVLKYTRCNAVLVEHGFFTNKKEKEFLNRSDVRQKIAETYLQIIKKYNE